MVLPLQGVRVLELNKSGVAGNAAQLLGDMGAEVIKVEHPDGDEIRNYPAQFRLPDGNSQVFANINRNKKSIAVNLKESEGRELLLDLVAEVDAVIEGFRPGVVDRLGIGYDDVRHRNDSIVYCSITGYGQDGPYAQWAGHDINYISVAGLLGMTGKPDGPPVLSAIPIADYAGSLMAAFQVSSAVRGAERNGEGQYIDVSMTDVAAFLFGWIYLPFTHHPDSDGLERGKSFQTGVYPCYNVYETKDGRYISVGAYEPYFWEDLCYGLKLAEYSDPEYRFAGEEVKDAIAERFAEKSLDRWMDELDPTDIPVAPVLKPEEVWSDEQIRSRGLQRRVEKDGEEFTLIDMPVETDERSDFIRSNHPDIGEHSREIATHLGLSDEEINHLIQSGVLHTTSPGDTE
jgi:crotonobetainyl-CoA:carnitine CoA-transferase CaiB-like acyl-CoA transferase